MSPKLARYVRKYSDDFDIVHAINYHAAPALIGTLLSSVPVVITPFYHGETASRFRNLVHVWYRIPARRMLRRIASVVCETSQERDRLLATFPEVRPKIEIIPPGTSRRPPAERPFKEHIRVLSVGRLDVQKRVDHALRAFQYLPGNYVLAVVGDGPARADFEREAMALGLADRVIFLGRLSNSELSAQWDCADVFISLSRYEAWGLGVSDALATGIPCVVSSIPAHREVSGLDPGMLLKFLWVPATQKLPMPSKPPMQTVFLCPQDCPHGNGSPSKSKWFTRRQSKTAQSNIRSSRNRLARNRLWKRKDVYRAVPKSVYRWIMFFE